MIGSELSDLLAPSLEEAAALGIHSMEQALDYIGGKIKVRGCRAPRLGPLAPL